MFIPPTKIKLIKCKYNANVLKLFFFTCINSLLFGKRFPISSK